MTVADYLEGSIWRKWDLHIHTPESHTASYGSGDEAWVRFIEDLAALPKEFAVTGINDYLWVDGYQRVLEAKDKSLLPNIHAIFPVVELRLDSFVGTDSRLQRVNAHAIFAPGTDPELIRTQFINRLVASFKLSSPYEYLEQKWEAVPTREALQELGRLIKATVPEKERQNFGSDLVEGFNNWVIPLDDILKARDAASFREQPLIGLGKTEWADIPWSNHTIAAKKNLISSVDLLFSASESPATCVKAREQLEKSKVNERLLDCSDAHAYSDSENKDRLGNCFTWICADPTLAGLKHALFEYPTRVFIGEEPLLISRQRSDPTNFISRVRISPVDPANRPAPGFDVELPLNASFVAVIGNKGSGKSALLDSIALAANSHNEEHFTFLSTRRYRKPRGNKAAAYKVEIGRPTDEVVGPIPLSSPADQDAPERMRYLPQKLLESLCNKEPGVPDEAFESELRLIIFSHVPEHQRLGARSLDELIGKRGRALERQIEQKRTELSQVNRTIAGLEERLRPSRLKGLESKLRAVDEQIAQHDQARPADPKPPPDTEGSPTSAELERINSELKALGDGEEADRELYGQLRKRLDAAENLAREIEGLRERLDEYRTEAASSAAEIGLELDQLVQVKINLEPLERVRQKTIEALNGLDAKLGPEGSYSESRAELEGRVSDLRARLDEPRKEYEQELQRLSAWKEARNRVVGSRTDEGTREYLSEEIQEARTIPDRLERERLKRLAISEGIHGLLLEKVEMYRELHSPVQEFLSRHPLAKHEFSLSFAAQLEIGAFTNPFLSRIDRGIAGSFYGREASEIRVDARVKSVRPEDWSSVREFLEAHDGDLHSDRRESDTGSPLDCPSDQLRQGQSLAEVYDFLFGLSYLNAEYELQSEGRSVSELSPGQKGTILLMFYLLVDRSGRPIALDQPDENLDNQTVSTLLHPAIREAKATKQILVVTHSPNLAIAGDADQVIVAANDGNEFTYESGSIENPRIRDHALRFLEGGWPVFTGRHKVYTVTKPNAGSS